MADIESSKEALNKTSKALDVLPGAKKNTKSDEAEAVSKAVDAGLTALSQLDKSPEAVTQAIGQAAKAVKKVKKEAENLNDQMKKISPPEEDEGREEIETRKSPVPVWMIAGLIGGMALIGGALSVPVMLVASPVNTVVSMTVDIWQDQDEFLKGTTKQILGNFILKSLDWVEAKAERIALWTHVEAKANKLRNTLFLKILNPNSLNVFNSDDSEWDKTYKTIKRIEDDAFKEAFKKAKDEAVKKAAADGLDVGETRRACNDKKNPNANPNYYYLYSVVDAYLLNEREDYSLSNYDPYDTKSIENCLDNAPLIVALCPFTVELKSKTIIDTDGVQTKVINYYDPTFYPYSKLSCFEALGIDSEEEQPGFEKMSRYETSEMKYEIAELQDENTTEDMGLDVHVPYTYDKTEEVSVLRTDPVTGVNYYEYIPAQITTFKNAQDFIDQMLPILQKICEENGWTCAPYMVIQMGKETGWGEHAPGFNFGGQKATPNTPESQKQLLWTWEVVNGQRIHVQDWFLKYDTAEEGIKGYCEFFVKSSFFHDALYAKSPAEFVDIVAPEDGRQRYASDPDYGPALLDMIASYGVEDLCK